MTGRYQHLTQAAPPLVELGLAPSRPVSGEPSGLIHVRALLFIVFALLVGAGLFSIAPKLATTGVAEAASGESASLAPVAAPTPAEPRVGETAGDSANGDTLAPLAPAQVVTEATGSQGISPIFSPEVQVWAPKILGWSQSYGLDPDIIATIMQIESCGDPAAESYAGAQGLFQVMPFHFSAGEEMRDPDTNAKRGISFYQRQLEYTGQNIYLSFAGYNGGYAASGSSFAYWANETQRYFTWASGIYDDAKAGLPSSPTLQQWLDAGGRSLCQSAAQRLGI